MKNIALLVIAVLMASCASKTSVIQTVDENEAFKYERKYLAESKSLKNNFSKPIRIKWIQPSNKKEACKIYVRNYEDNDTTLDEKYKIFWDGECKNGYADGLGREFERGTTLNREALAIYKGASKEPQYFIQKDNLENITLEGDINSGYFVATTIIDDNYNFNITYTYGFVGSSLHPFTLMIYGSPFEDNLIYQKGYSNFVYRLYDMSNNEFEQRKFQCDMLSINDSQNLIQNGFGFTISKYGQKLSGEFVDGKLIRYVGLPENYFVKIGNIFDEVAEAGRKAKQAQQEALKIYKQYIGKICNDSVHVTFLDDSEYKVICNNSEYSINLKEKIENKFAQINLQKKQARDQLNQKKMVDAQIAQANAAQRQANAATRSAAAAEEQASNSQTWGNINTDILNTTKSIQHSSPYPVPSLTPFSGINNLNNNKVRNCWTASGIEFCN